MGNAYARLKRLTSSRKGREVGVERYSEELRRLARSAGDERYLKSKERLFKALGNSMRLRMIKMMAARELCVCEMMVALGLTQPNASHHLNILEREGIVKKRREGKWLYYRLSTPKILELVDGISVK
ncbi:MAG: helix-turn-helix transcriptional regulator [Candidatus Brockarchaeota archaeon]|nr:helix-turn-helix transcriptional regulator [Candidatus Brockarchaeota archaeon]